MSETSGSGLLVLIGHEGEEPVYGTADGKFVLRTHSAGQCSGDFCGIHSPSDHPLRDAPMNWRSDRALLERVCEHGVGHPDRDDIEYKRRMFGDGHADSEAIHGCDGCCA